MKMIVNLEQFKKDRAEARTIEEIKLFATKYGIKLSGTDNDIYRLFHSGPTWAAHDLVTMRPWRILDSMGNILKEFRSFRDAQAYQVKYELNQCRIVENKW